MVDQDAQTKKMVEIGTKIQGLLLGPLAEVIDLLGMDVGEFAIRVHHLVVTIRPDHKPCCGCTEDVVKLRQAITKLSTKLSELAGNCENIATLNTTRPGWRDSINMLLGKQEVEP